MSFEKCVKFESASNLIRRELLQNFRVRITLSNPLTHARERPEARGAETVVESAESMTKGQHTPGKSHDEV